MGIVITICITILLISLMYFYVYYNLKINEDFKQKSRDIVDIINNFENTYIEGMYSDKTKFKGNALDVKNLCKTLKNIIN